MENTTRRYQVGEQKEYDLKYRIHSNESEILNWGKKPNYTVDLSNRPGIQSEIMFLQGGADDKYFDNSDRRFYLAKIPTLRQKLAAVKQEFADYQQSQVNQGNRKPASMPLEINKKYLHLQAAFDVANEELEALNEMLKKYTDEDKQIRNEKMLQYGLQCAGHIGTGGILTDIDGQKVSVIQGVLVIDEEDSPYDGMLVAFYKERAKEWNAARYQRETERQIRYDNEMRQFGKSDIVIGHGRHTVSRASLPKFPEGEKNYKKSKQAVESTSA